MGMRISGHAAREFWQELGEKPKRKRFTETVDVQRNRFLSLKVELKRELKVEEKKNRERGERKKEREKKRNNEWMKEGRNEGKTE